MTKRRLSCPLWTHLPALALLAWMLWATWRAWPLPAVGPVHFGFSGRPDSAGAPLVVALVVLGLSLCFLLLGIGIDESWARQERRKAFNWLALFDEFTVGFYAGMLFTYLRMLRHPEAFPAFTPVPGFAIAVAAAALAALLEWARPWTPREQPPEGEDAAQLREHLAFRARAGQRWVYWETQNVWWMNLVLLLAGGALVVGAIAVWSSSPWLTLAELLPLLLILPLYGGFRVTVIPERTELRWGLFGIRLLRVPTADIADATMREFSPLREYGGYGIRLNRRGWGFFLHGHRGVLVTTARGKQFLLGSDTPERLAAAIQFAREGVG